MTLHEQYNETPAIGYYCLGNFGGLEVLDIEHGTEDKLVTCFNWSTGKQMIRRNTVYTTPGGRRYIRKAGDRYYLDEMMKTF